MHKNYSILNNYSGLILLQTFEKKKDATPPHKIQPTYIRMLYHFVLNDGNIISVVATTNPSTQCDAIAKAFSNTSFISLEKSKSVASIAKPRGISTEKSRVDIPADILSYIPKNKRSVDELKPGTIKLSPQTTPHIANPTVVAGIVIAQRFSQQ